MTEDVFEATETDAVRTFGGDAHGQKDAWQELNDEGFTDRSGGMEKAVTSQQHDTDDPHQADWYEPPYNPVNLALLLERSETHKACVQAKSQGVAGHGFDIVTHARVESDAPPGEDVVRDFWHGSESTWQLGPDRLPATPDEVLEQSWNDYEAVGWLSIETLINDQTAEPTGLAHIPAHTIRKRKDAHGYVQIDPDTEKIEGYFAQAGARYGDEKTFVDADDGTVADSIRGVDVPANELFVMRNYSALAPHYGVPDIIPALQTLFGDLAARKFNAKFFENDGVPRFAVIVEGGELTEAAWTELEEKFAELRLEESSHRGVILEAVSGVTGSFEDAHNVTLRIEPLTVGVEEDASFIEYRKENEHDIGKAHSVPPVIYNRTEHINFANAKAQRQRFANEVVSPKQEKFSARLYRLIHQSMLGVDGWTIDFRLRGGDDPQRQAEIDKLRIEGTAGVLTVDEARAQIDLEPLGGPEGEMLVADLAGNPAGGPGQVSPGGEASDVNQARRSQRAEDYGYSVVDRVEADD